MTGRRAGTRDAAILVRLSDAEAWALDVRAQRDGLSRPEVVRRALQRDLLADAEPRDEPDPASRRWPTHGV